MSEQKTRGPINFAEKNAALAEEAQAKLRAEKELIDAGLQLTEEEETARYVTWINGREYYMPSILEWTFEQDEKVLEIVEPLLPLIQTIFSTTDLTYVDLLRFLPEILSTLVKEKRHRLLLAVMLVPSGCEFDVDRVGELESEMKYARNKDLREVLRRFFTTGGN